MKIFVKIVSVFCVFFSFSIANAKFLDSAKFPAWAEKAIDRVSSEKIMTGDGDGNFHPMRVLNRAEATALIVRLKKIDLSKVSPSSKFVDVPREAWFARSIAESERRGWVKGGFSDGGFHPDAPVNRAEWATMIARAFDLEPGKNPNFRDVPTKVWFSDSIFSLAANGLIRKKSVFFRPERTVTRADAAWVCSEILKKPRLMGTSKTNKFDKNPRVDSRRVAIKPRNFNKYKQGFDIAKKEVVVRAVPSRDFVKITRKSPWTDLGTIEIQNNYGTRVDFRALELRLRFDRTSVGPASNFVARIVAVGKNDEKPFVAEQNFGRTGRIFLTGIRRSMNPEEQLRISVKIRPDSDETFYKRSGTGKISVTFAEGIGIAKYVRKTNRTSTNFQSAPVRFERRELATIEFSP